MRYWIDPKIFAAYPGFRRAVLVVSDVSNQGLLPAVEGMLRQYEQDATRAELADPYETPALRPWADLFRGMGLNPKRYPPSVINLVKRANKGAKLPYVNTLVALFNCVSLRYLIPCGADDLAVVKGDLRLTYASGQEIYVPLGQPDVIEHPPAGEIIYYDDGGQQVFCRAWCWKNGDVSKITEQTAWAAINLDALTPATVDSLPEIAEQLAVWLREYTGAETELHLLGPNQTEFML